VTAWVTAGPASAVTLRAAKPPLVDATCTSPGLTRPDRIILACGDGNAIAQNLSWSKWGPRSATASGALRQNDCTPDCAEGTFHAFPARFVLSEMVAAAGRNYFTRVTIRFAGREPSGRRVETVSDCFVSPPERYIPRCPANLRGAG
jgi:hypothetical protein